MTLATRAYAEYSFASDGMRLHVARIEPRTIFVAEIVWRVVAEGGSAPPACVLTADAARELFDSLWRAGLRPRDSGQQEGKADAMTAHIADLRAVAFKLLKV